MSYTGMNACGHLVRHGTPRTGGGSKNGTRNVACPSLGKFPITAMPSGLHLIDFHPVHVVYGWKTAFRREEVSYQIPTVGYTKDDYLKAITESGLTILDVTDIPVSEAPEGYLPQEMRRMYADKPLCLSMLAQK